ncbi:hypothetical protein CS379_27950 [Methylobacterium frigidaeris]|nr:hypothetical protein CS379_27950 [Methylobacterium frigidaeris]
MDIEALLVRAYREKRVDRYGQDGRQAGAVALGLGSGPRAPGSQLGGPERVDTSSYAANSAARTREAFLRLAGTADGLLALHDAVLALPDMYVEYGAGADFLVWDAETAERHGEVITLKGGKASIQATRRRGGRGEGRNDRVPVGLPRPLTTLPTSVLIITHGREASRPDVMDASLRRRPVYRPGTRDVAGFEFVADAPLDVVAFERARYAAWHAALGMLAAARAGCPEFAVTGPAAPLTIWSSEALDRAPVTRRKARTNKANSERIAA